MNTPIRIHTTVTAPAEFRNYVLDELYKSVFVTEQDTTGVVASYGEITVHNAPVIVTLIRECEWIDDPAVECSDGEPCMWCAAIAKEGPIITYYPEAFGECRQIILNYPNMRHETVSMVDTAECIANALYSQEYV